MMQGVDWYNRQEDNEIMTTTYKKSYESMCYWKKKLTEAIQNTESEKIIRVYEAQFHIAEKAWLQIASDPCR